MEFITQLVDRLVVLNFGETIAQGSAETIRGNAAVQQAYLGGAHANAI